MADELTVTLYKVANCGYIKEDDGSIFGGLRDICDDFLEWLPHLATVGETATFEPAESDSFLRTFCFDARRIPGVDAILIATWNESENAEDEIQLLAVNAAIGHADISSVEIDKGSLPGYPAYFVFMPADGRLLNLRFEHRLNGTRALQRYIQGFMARESRFCMWDPKNADRLLGYSPDGNKVAKGYEPKFEYQLVRRGGRIDWFRSQSASIRKVVRRAVVYPAVEEHRAFFDGAQRLLGLAPNRRLKAGINFQYEYKTHLDLPKLDQIIEGCANPENAEDSWSDVGFEMARQSGKIHWLSGSYAREKASLRVAKTSGGMVDTEELAVLLGKGHLQRLLASVLG